MKYHLYDIVNGVIYKKPLWNSSLAMTNAALSLNKYYPSTGVLFGTWCCSLTEGKKRGNAICDDLPYGFKEILVQEHFAKEAVYQ